VLWDRKDELEQQLIAQLKQVSAAQQKELEKPPVAPAPLEQPKKAEEPKPKKEKPKKPLTILDIILYGLLLLLAGYLIGLFFMFITPFLRHKRRVKRALREKSYNLAIALVYNYLAHVLSLLGLRYPVTILPEQYLKSLEQKCPLSQEQAQRLTLLFIEARYSFHELGEPELDEALACYHHILLDAQINSPAFSRRLVSFPIFSKL
jgi:hypothetical protein